MQDVKELIKAKVDVADLIADYVPLKPAGSGSFKGVCPFHAERTPSFHVSRERQIWRCFGCDKGGDVFSFMMEMEGVTFPEALRLLGTRVGVEVPEYRPVSKEQASKKETALQIHDVASKYYAALLERSAEGKIAREYVATRKLSPELLTKFQIGAAGDAWDGLVRTLKQKGYSEQAMLESGLCLKRKTGDGLVDRFRNRLMIPICDAQGRVIAFTGRIIPAAVPVGVDPGGKYVNSPETEIFKKGEALYGLHLAKTAIRKSGEAIIVEGNLDVVASHKAGVENVVAASGTALTEAQLRLLSRYTKRITFCLDDDAAGFAAAKRVLELAMKLQSAHDSLRLEVRCLSIPDGLGKDPDDVVTKSPEAWQQVVAHSEEAIEYFFKKTLRRFEEAGGAGNVNERTKLIDELLPEVARLRRPDERHLYLLRLADVTHVDTDILREMLATEVAKRSKESLGPALQSTKAKAPTENTQSKAAAFLLGIALVYEELVPHILAYVKEELITDPWKTLYAHLRVLYTHSELPPSSGTQINPFSRLRAYLDAQGEGSLTSVLDSLALRTDEILAGLTPEQIRGEVDRHRELFSDVFRKQHRKELEAAIRQAELSGDTDRLTELLTEYSLLLRA